MARAGIQCHISGQFICHSMVMNDLSHPRFAREPSLETSLDTVSDPAGLVALQSDWDRLLEQDPTAGVFLSYNWLAPALLENAGRWRIFVVRNRIGEATCIFPTKYRVHWSKSRNQFQTEIEAAGRLAWGERTGFICAPDQEEPALRSLAKGIARYPWKSLNLRYEPTGYRARIFAEALDTGFSYEFREYRINKGTVDNLTELVVPLDGGFDRLMADRISTNTRQKIRRKRRKLLETGRYRISTTTSATIERDIGGLLRNWVSQWTPKKGRAGALDMANSYARALLTAKSLGQLYLPILWKGETMLGALGHVLDHRQSSVHFLLAGRDPKADESSIGLLLHAHALEWAAEQGYRHYNFGHGDQAYKKSFGVDTHRSHYLSVRRAGSPNVFDPLGQRSALRRLSEFAKAKQYHRVARGTEQLSEMPLSKIL